MLQIDPTRHYPTFLVIVKDYFDHIQVKESNKYFTNEKQARNYAQNNAIVTGKQIGRAHV